MKKLIILNFLFFAFVMSVVEAQVTQEWLATYSGVGTGYNTPRKSAIDKFGNYIVAGSSENFQDYDYIVLKYNISGNLLWSRRYNSPVNRYDYLTDMILDDSGNVYITGESQVESSGGDLDWITIKYKPNGDTAWIRSFEWTGNGPDEPFSITLDKLNNVFITGFCLASPPNGRDMVTAKYNSNGDFQWAKNYSSANFGSDWGYSVVTDDSNNVYSSGYGSIPTGNEIVTIKYNTHGDEIWIRKFPTLGGDYLRPVKSIKDKENNIIVNDLYYPSGDYGFNTIKYNTNGDLLWNRFYKGAGNLNFCFALCTDSSGNIYAAGRNTSVGTGNDFLTIKYNMFGDTSWIRIYDGGDSLSDETNSIGIDSLENVYVTGKSQSPGIAFLDFLTIKYNSTGNLVWEKRYNGLGIPYMSDVAYTISVDKKGSAIISGNSELSNNHSGIVTIKYSSVTNIFNNNLKNENLEYSLFQNYPNPFNPITTISYDIPNDENVNIKVFDLTGREIQTLVNEMKQSGKYKIIFDGSNLASGVYFYKIEAGSFVKTRRMLLIK